MTKITTRRNLRNFGTLLTFLGVLIAYVTYRAGQRTQSEIEVDRAEEFLSEIEGRDDWKRILFLEDRAPPSELPEALELKLAILVNSFGKSPCLVPKLAQYLAASLLHAGDYDRATNTARAASRCPPNDILARLRVSRVATIAAGRSNTAEHRKVALELCDQFLGTPPLEDQLAEWYRRRVLFDRCVLHLTSALQPADIVAIETAKICFRSLPDGIPPPDDAEWISEYNMHDLVMRAVSISFETSSDEVGILNLLREVDRHIEDSSALQSWWKDRGAEYLRRLAGRLCMSIGRLPRAQTYLDAALRSAVARKDDRSIATIALLGSLVLSRQNRWELASEYAQRAWAAALRSGVDGELRGQIYYQVINSKILDNSAGEIARAMRQLYDQAGGETEDAECCKFLKDKLHSLRTKIDTDPPYWSEVSNLCHATQLSEESVP